MDHYRILPVVLPLHKGHPTLNKIMLYVSKQLSYSRLFDNFIMTVRISKVAFTELEINEKVCSCLW